MYQASFMTTQTGLGISSFWWICTSDKSAMHGQNASPMHGQNVGVGPAYKLKFVMMALKVVNLHGVIGSNILELVP